MDDRRTTEAALHAWLDAVNRQDLDAYVASVTPDYTWTLGASTTTGPAVSAEAWRVLFEAFPDYRLDLVETIVEPPRVAWRARMSGTQVGPLRFRGTGSWDHPFPATGKRFEVECAGWFEVRGGRVAVNRAYWQPADMMRQLGLA